MPTTKTERERDFACLRVRETGGALRERERERERRGHRHKRRYIPPPPLPPLRRSLALPLTLVNERFAR